MQDNVLIIKDINVQKGKIEFESLFNGKWKDFLLNSNFKIEYNFNLENIPYSILIIPFLCNILPISWVYNLKIEVDEIDKDFLKCIDDLKKGYGEMYPSLNFKGKLTYKKIINNDTKKSNSATLFSGGVDAYDTLFRNIKSNPLLITLWGADIDLLDLEGWNNVKSYNEKVADNLGLEFQYVKTNFRKFINYENVSKFVKKQVKDEWWHGFQHGIGILGHTAPIAYYYNLKYVYIASSFTADQWGKYTCASDPRIDNNLKFCGCKIIHDGYDYSRQDKIKNIVDYKLKNSIEKIPIRVCWSTSGGNNCCKCEKCTRTIAGILAENENPNDYGFYYNSEVFQSNLIKYSKYNFRYIPIQKRTKENFDEKNVPIELKKFRKMKLYEKKPIYAKILGKINNKI